MLELLYGGEVEGFELVSDEITGNSRWSIHHEMIFKHDGKIYSADYSKGATEQQDESPWEYETEVEAKEVKAVEVTITKYVPIE